MTRSIALRTYWGDWMKLSMSETQLFKLRAHLQAGSTKTIALGGHVFRPQGDVLFFANSGTPSKYYFEMSPQEVIAVIEEALS
ncbi:hypothetical protein [Pseudomonas sp. NPDC079086]|uniref:hypothetical protein n=1 Tax=unclassified Pseudomonas TaxID=196821 RepID=UPI0037C97428